MSQQDFIIRTEDILLEDILDLYVGTEKDEELLAAIKAPSPLVLVGSRGTGKSFLLRVAEQQQLQDFESTRVLPIYVSFIRSSLVQATNVQAFQSWMLARLCSRIIRTLYSRGLLSNSLPAAEVLAGQSGVQVGGRTELEKVATEFEESYRRPDQEVAAESIPDVEQFRDAIQDLCDALNIKRFNILFDEAAHIFRPEQQRQFFTLFRDLRSPYLTCNAAVYPGVTSYGDTFEPAHDARFEYLNRDISDKDYLKQMREIIIRQADTDLQRNIEKNGENFDALAFAVSGNPRLLLKTIALAPGLRSGEVTSAIKDFYRSAIWAEHSGLSEKYGGHRPLIDWGREFVESTLVPDALQKNDLWSRENKPERTCYFWVSRDVPEVVKEALRILSYTGIVSLVDKGVVATRRQIGDRFVLNVGCLSAPESSPIPFITDLRQGLSVKRFTEYGQSHSSFDQLVSDAGGFGEVDGGEAIGLQLAKSVDGLDLSLHQKESLHSIGIETIGEALNSSEEKFQTAYYIGPKRSRKMMNVVTAAILEYLSG